ncbi:membrane protease YdiL (CAAX protease family) [Paenibacillus shirakamiensis]|uniref:Membrane protease YdiL (CAAX protease family) n=1 Tax=Paenibacillus shirakamiensis TaxID=1265935 RepID=A0ABS4JK73_9BACL|nr:type II CAAX endopeptidase family protein [Paenibacillus shirakamiensis]MBP2002097.1 membrane protease YdiL (CAAX protease family) [Paenibacillus shirakamiensis]
MKVAKPLPFRTQTLWIAAIISLIIFVVLQVVPISDANSEQDQQPQGDIISKEDARMSATRFVSDSLHLNLSDNVDTLVTYKSNSKFYGYLSRENLVKEYISKYEKRFPYDVYRVTFNDPATYLNSLNVDVQMVTGKVLGFEKVQDLSKDAKALMAEKKDGLDKLKEIEGNLTLAQKEQLALPYLKALGYNTNELTVDRDSQDLGLHYNLKGATIGKSQGQLVFNYEYGEVSSFDPAFTVPDEHTAYVDSQSKLANWLYFLGYALLSFVLGILAIVYSSTTRPFASFRRGIFLTMFYFIVNAISIINLLPVFKSEEFSTSTFIILLIVQGIFTLIVTASVYFSLVGGDGLWRQQGKVKWMKSSEPGYAKHVLHSMSNGYAWAFILLGVQSIIYLALERILGTWSTTDDTQSTYNMLFPLIFPLMAWTAGIGEEAVYRLFGIPMLQKLFKNTFIAGLISALIWACGHTLYPIYPVYSRPIELAVIGLLFSFIFLRYGFITVLFAHVIFDSILMGLSLILMKEPLNIGAGLFYIVLPAIVGYVIYRWNLRRSTPNLILLKGEDLR